MSQATDLKLIINDLQLNIYEQDGTRHFEKLLDLIIEFYEDVSNYIEYTFDDMMVDPESFEEVFQSEGDWFDGVRFDLVFKDETSSLAVKFHPRMGRRTPSAHYVL